MEISLCLSFEAIEFQRHFPRRPLKVWKLVRTNQERKSQQDFKIERQKEKKFRVDQERK